MRQQTQTVLDDDDSTIDDDAEVDGTKAHQIGAHLVLEHAGNGEQHGQRNDQCGRKCRFQISENQKEHHDHQQSAFHQILFNGGNRGVDQMRAIVDRANRHPLRQRTLDLLQFFRDALRDGTAVLINQQHCRPENDLPAIVSGSTCPQVRALANVGNVRYPHWNTIPGPDDDLADLLEIHDLTWRANQVLFAILLYIACADIRIVRSQRRHYVPEAEAVCHQLARVGHDMKLFLKSADGVDFIHTGDVAELRLDDPVLNGSQIARTVGLTACTFGIAFRFNGIHVDLAKASRNRPHDRFDSGG